MTNEERVLHEKQQNCAHPGVTWIKEVNGYFKFGPCGECEFFSTKPPSEVIGERKYVDMAA